MMTYVRVMVRLVVLIAIQIVFACIAVFFYLKHHKNSDRHRGRILHFTRLWGKVCCRAFHFQVKVEGTPPRPGARLIVANHIGSPDIFVLASTFDGFFVSKHDIANWPVVGTMMRLGATIFVDRAQRRSAKGLADHISEVFVQGFPVILFPEGGAHDGKNIAPFKPAGFEPAHQRGVPVLPVVIRYHDGNTPSVACWQNKTFGSHLLDLLKQKRLEVTLRILPEIAGEADRRALALKAHEGVAKAHSKFKSS